MKITLDNFQIVQHAEIDVQGITLVTGPNDSGKSSLIRALKAFTTGQGSPDLIRRGAKSARVTIETGGRVFVWNRLADTVTYVIDGVEHKKLNKKSLQDVITDAPLRYEDVERERVCTYVLSQEKHLFFLGHWETKIHKLFSRPLCVGALREIRAGLSMDPMVLRKAMTAQKSDVEILQAQQTNREATLARLPDPARLGAWLASYRSLERALASASGLIGRLDNWLTRLGHSSKTLNNLAEIVKQSKTLLSYYNRSDDNDSKSARFRSIESRVSSLFQSHLNQQLIVVQRDRFIHAREDLANWHGNHGPVARNWLAGAGRSYNHFSTLQTITALSDARGSIERRRKELNDYRRRINQSLQEVSRGLERMTALQKVTGDLSRLRERLTELGSEWVALLRQRDGCSGGLAELHDCPHCSRPFASESGDKPRSKISHGDAGWAFGSGGVANAAPRQKHFGLTAIRRPHFGNSIREQGPVRKGSLGSESRQPCDTIAATALKRKSVSILKPDACVDWKVALRASRLRINRLDRLRRISNSRDSHEVTGLWLEAAI